MERQGKQIRGQSLAKKVWAVPESLGKDGPGELHGKISVRISPGEGKDVLRLRAEGNGEKKHP